MILSKQRCQGLSNVARNEAGSTSYGARTGKPVGDRLFDRGVRDDFGDAWLPDQPAKERIRDDHGGHSSAEGGAGPLFGGVWKPVPHEAESTLWLSREMVR